MTQLGSPRVHHRSTDSTNLRARELAAAGAPHGTLVTAFEQSAGRGRQGRAWSAPAGTAVLMSLILRRHTQLLSLAAGVAVAETAEHFGASDVAIKWPNDVWIAGRKAAGILVEGRPQEGWAVLGIGLNVAIEQEQFPAELRGRATSLGLGTDAVEPVLAELLARLGNWVTATDEQVLEAVRRRDALRGRLVIWSDGEGTAAGLDDEGRLMVETDRCIARLDAGEVHLSVS